MEPDLPDWLAQVIAPDRLEQILPWVQTGARIVLIVLLAWLMRALMRRVLNKIVARITEQTDDPGHARRGETLVRVLSYGLSVAIGVVTLLLILGEFGVSVAPLLGAAGVAGIAVGFGAQSLVKDFFTGFFLLLEDQIRTGDVISVAGYSGSVEEVNLRYIRLRDYEGTVHFIPNGLITGVSNSSRGFSFAVMDLSVSYQSNIEQAIEVISQTAQQMRNEIDWRASLIGEMEIAGVDKLDSSAVVIKCRQKTQALAQWKVRREFLKRIKQAFDANEIEIPYPHLTLVNPPTPIP